MSTATTPSSIHDLLENAPMSRTQIVAIIVTILLSALEGYDVLSLTFAAPAMTRAWRIDEAALGLMLSSGLAGMTLGSLGLGPFADIMGRKRVILAALALMILSGFWSALSQNVTDMALSRLVSGLGIGMLVAVITPLAAEFSNGRRRALAVSAVAVGFPIGGVLGGLGAAAMLDLYGWQSIFIAKSIAGLFLLPIVIFALPESPAMLLVGGRADALARINGFLALCGHAPVDRLPAPPARESTGYRAIFVPKLAGTTIRLVIANGLFVMTAHYFFSWLPQIVADEGFSASTGGLVSASANLSGIAGGLILGAAAHRAGLKTLVVASLAAFGVSTAAFGLVPPSLTLIFVTATICGFFLMSTIAGMYAVMASSYPAEARASACGLVIGVGRITSAAAPYLAGWLFMSGLNRGAVCVVFAACAILGAFTLHFQKDKTRAAS